MSTKLLNEHLMIIGIFEVGILCVSLYCTLGVASAYAGSIDVGFAPEKVFFNENNGHIYITNYNSSTVSEIDGDNVVIYYFSWIASIRYCI